MTFKMPAWQDLETFAKESNAIERAPTEGPMLTDHLMYPHLRRVRSADGGRPSSTTASRISGCQPASSV